MKSKRASPRRKSSKSFSKTELDLIKKVRDLSFDEPTLRKLEECSDKYNGPGPALEAVSTYIGLAPLRKQVEDLEGGIQKLQKRERDIVA